jgi:glycosyltransferase involved in cell wall biosynthesis/HEAT repeat protein
VRRHLHALAAERTVVGALGAATALAAAVGPSTGADEVADLVAAAHSPDPLLAIGAIHAIAGAPGAIADETLLGLLHSGDSWRRQHAAWAIGGRAPASAATECLVAMAGGGGFAGMLAQRSLGRQALRTGGELCPPVSSALAAAGAPQARARLVETLGLDPAHEATALLTRIALDAEGENSAVRSAAVAALGDRGGAGSRATLVGLAASSDEQVAPQAVLALLDASPQRSPAGDRPSGLAVAQLFLHADLDPGLTRAGIGDTGGIASLLVLLGEALAATPGVARVLTLSRGAGTDALADALWPREEGASFGAVPMPASPMRDAWEHRVVVERGIRRQLRAQGPFDVIHLRMGDVGTLAAARVARELRIPVVFTAAPDPHAGLDAAGELDDSARLALGERDAREHWWFRARLVERLTRESAGLAVMPRENAMREIPRLLGIDPHGFAGRAAVIPEGVHAGSLRRARADARRAEGGGSVPVLDDLSRRIGAMPGARRALPLLVTVGRLAAAKGTDRIVEAWAGDEALRARTNLVVVGGDLEQPSPEERETLAAIEAALGRHPEAREGLVMLGHRPHLDAMRVLARAAEGEGVYVCGSEKEEYGLAIVEALGAGLLAVAPEVGGPATYIDGRNGVLVDGTRAESIREGIHRALTLAPVPGRAEASRAAVLGEMTIERMAGRLVELYLRVAPEVAVGTPAAAGG